MDGTGCVTSKSAWKWDETVGDIGMRLCDLAHQDYVTVGRTLADIAGGQAVRPGRDGARPGGRHPDRERAGPAGHPVRAGLRQIGIAYSSPTGSAAA